MTETDKKIDELDKRIKQAESELPKGTLAIESKEWKHLVIEKFWLNFFKPTLDARS